MGLTLSQCKKCGRIFQSYHQDVCPLCVEEREKSFIKVRDYIYQHPQDVSRRLQKDRSGREADIGIPQGREIDAQRLGFGSFVREVRQAISKGQVLRRMQGNSSSRFCLTCLKKSARRPDQKKLDSDPSREDTGCMLTSTINGDEPCWESGNNEDRFDFNDRIYTNSIKVQEKPQVSTEKAVGTDRGGVFQRSGGLYRRTQSSQAGNGDERR